MIINIKNTQNLNLIVKKYYYNNNKMKKKWKRKMKRKRKKCIWIGYWNKKIYMKNMGFYMELKKFYSISY